VAHYHGVQQVGDYGEMHVERDGFVGIADIGSGVTTVAAVFPEAQARAISRGGGRERFLDAWLRSRPQLADRFHGAAPADRAWAVGPFASRARRAWHPGGGAVLVGDAADFFDPFTGEGIYAALRGGELAAAAIRSALGAASERDVLEAWQGYESARRREFAGKWRVERIIGTCVAFPAVVSRAVRSLSTHKELADLLVGVTGDFVPATEVLRASYLVRVFLAGRRAASATRIV
jgi:flavin-dependent dehydrogenase